MRITQKLGKKVLEVVDCGLTAGLGVPKPGKMCVEAAVCYAMGEDHGDSPTCVSSAVRLIKIGLNDRGWSSNSARAVGLRRLAVAQLGSSAIDNAKFLVKLSEKLIRFLTPIALRAAASIHPGEDHKKALENAAKYCAKKGSKKAAAYAERAANYALAAAQVAGIADAARAASYARARTAARAAELAAACAAACGHAPAAAPAAASYAAASYAADAIHAASGGKLDEMLTLAAELVIDTLRDLDAPGIAIMDKLCPKGVI